MTAFTVTTLVEKHRLGFRDELVGITRVIIEDVGPRDLDVTDRREPATDGLAGGAKHRSGDDHLEGEAHGSCWSWSWVRWVKHSLERKNASRPGQTEGIRSGNLFGSQALEG